MDFTYLKKLCIDVIRLIQHIQIRKRRTERYGRGGGGGGREESLGEEPEKNERE